MSHEVAGDKLVSPILLPHLPWSKAITFATHWSQISIATTPAGTPQTSSTKTKVLSEGFCVRFHVSLEGRRHHLQHPAAVLTGGAWTPKPRPTSALLPSICASPPRIFEPSRHFVWESCDLPPISKVPQAKLILFGRSVDYDGKG